MNVFRTIQRLHQPNNSDMIKQYLETVNNTEDIETNIESINDDIRDHYLSKLMDINVIDSYEYMRIQKKLENKSHNEIYNSEFVLTMAQTIVQLNDKINEQQQIIDKLKHLI